MSDIKFREILVSPEWLLILRNALLPIERQSCGDASVGDRPSLALDQLCPIPLTAAGANAETHKLIFIGDISKEEFGKMIEESKETT